MQEYNTIIGNLFKSIDRRVFKRIVDKYRGEYYAKTMSCWEQFVCIFLGQILQNCKSLRDIEDFLLSNQNQWYHLGIKHPIARSTLSYANNTKSWEIYAELFHYLLHRSKCKQPIEQVVTLIDSTPIYLNLDLFTWAEENLRIKEMKMHVVYNLNELKPVYFTFTSPRVNDIEEGKLVEIVSNQTYVFDRGYMDFNWWSEIDDKGAYFVTRLKKNNGIKELSEVQVHNKNVSSQLIQLRTKRFKDGRYNKCSEKILKRIFVERAGENPLVLVTNDHHRSAEEIAELYKQRWQIELFFKWIKQNLEIKKFIGRSENAVKTQICIALIAYLVLMEARELKALLSEVCRYFTNSKFLKLINNSIFKTIKPRKYGRKALDIHPPWQLTLTFY